MAEIEATLGRGDVDGAVAALERLLGSGETSAATLFLAAQAYWMKGQLEEAEGFLRRGLALAPGQAEAYNNLGLLQIALGRFGDAETSLRRALELRPAFAWAHCNLGNALQAQRQLENAKRAYASALAVDQRHAPTHVNLGNLLRDEGDLSEAARHYEAALAIRPSDPGAWVGLGAAAQAQGELDQAIAAFRRALELRPGDPNAVSGLLFTLNVHPSIPPAQAAETAKTLGRQLADRVNRGQLGPDVAIAGRGPDVTDRPLRVGFVSGDLRAHPVGFFLQSVLGRLNPERLVAYAYATIPETDSVSDRLRPLFAGWHNITQLSDDAAAKLIRDDAIDILVDLAGHTAHNRLSLFARSTAPLKVSWLGYFATTGMPGIDYLLADEISAPHEVADRFSETIWRLPHGRFCFTPPGSDSAFPLSEPPALARRYVTFASFQNLLKIHSGVLELWQQVLSAVPDARLLIQNGALRYESSRTVLDSRLRAAGIDTARVSLRGAVPRVDYLRGHSGIDIILDTFPYTGATTTCEALWMGVPTVTVAGDTLVARQGAAILHQLGLRDWIATSPEEYVEMAVRHASRLESLALLRRELRGRLLDSPLCDAQRFACGLEDALFGMWRAKFG